MSDGDVVVVYRLGKDGKPEPLDGDHKKVVKIPDFQREDKVEEVTYEKAVKLRGKGETVDLYRRVNGELELFEGDVVPADVIYGHVVKGRLMRGATYTVRTHLELWAAQAVVVPRCGLRATTKAGIERAYIDGGFQADSDIEIGHELSLNSLFNLGADLSKRDTSGQLVTVQRNPKNDMPFAPNFDPHFWDGRAILCSLTPEKTRSKLGQAFGERPCLPQVTLLERRADDGLINVQLESGIVWSGVDPSRFDLTRAQLQQIQQFRENRRNEVREELPEPVIGMRTELTNVGPSFAAVNGANHNYPEPSVSSPTGRAAFSQDSRSTNPKHFQAETAPVADFAVEFGETSCPSMENRK